MGAASRLTILVCLITSVLGGTGWCANFVYKGAQKAQDLATGEKITIPTYLVLAEDGIVNVSDDYVYTKAKMVFVGGIAGRKRFLRIQLPDFRTLHLTTIVGGKLRAVTIVSRGVATDSNVGSHNYQLEVLSGVKKDPAERMPTKLQGVSVLTSGTGPNTGASGGLQLGTSKFSLVGDLTGQVQPGETVDQTVERVVAFLETKGFTEFTP